MTRADPGLDIADTLRAATQLRDRGWRPFPVDHPNLTNCAGAGHPDSRRCPPGQHDKRGKHPALAWGVATRHPTTDTSLQTWFARAPRNIGIGCKGSGLVVFDEDVDGALTELAEQLGETLPPTYRVRTSRGWHWYFLTPPGRTVGNKTGPALAAAHIDVRGGSGDGGYVVAAGSVHASGHLYVAEDDQAPALPVPGWLLDLIDAAPHRPEGDSGGSRTGSTPTATDGDRWTDTPRYGTRDQLVGQYRRHLGEIRDRGSDFRHQLFLAARDAHRLVLLGVLEQQEMDDDLCAAIGRVWGAAPDADDGEIVMGEAQEAALTSPWQLIGPYMGPEPLGGRDRDRAGTSPLRDGGTIHADVYDGILDEELADAIGPDMAAEARDRVFRVEVERELRRRAVRRAADEEERPAAEPIDAGVLRWSRIAEVQPPKMRVARLLAESSITWLSGRSGSYKSFLGVAIGLSVATGTDVCGHDEWKVSAPLSVLFVAAEGPAGASVRAQAYAAHHELDREVLEERFRLYPKRVDLRSESGRRAVRTFVETEQIGMVVYDTWHKVTPGLDDNSRAEVGEVMGFLDTLRDDLGVEAVVVDHTGHAGERTVGSSSKVDDADCSLIIRMPGRERTPDVQRTLIVDKLKDAETSGAWDLRLVAVPGVLDNEGHPARVLAVGSVTAVGALCSGGEWHLIPAEELPKAVRDATTYGSAVRDAYRVLVGIDDEIGLTPAEVRAILDEGPREHGKTAVYAAVAVLTTAGVVVRNGTRLLVPRG